VSAAAKADAFARILVICTRQIGDVLLTTPLIRAAKARWPDAAIDVLGFVGTLGMLRGNGDVAALIEVPAGQGWWRSIELLRRIWRRYDLALIAQYSDRAHLYGFAAAGRRSGLAFIGAKSWWKRRLLEHTVLLTEHQEHAVVEKLRLLEPWGLPQRATLSPPPAQALPDDIVAALRSPYVVVHVPSLVRYKQWPVEHFAALVRALVARDVQVALSGGGSDADRQLCAEVAGIAASPRLIDLAGRLSLAQMAALLRGAAAYVGPDTSITHLAAACGTPVIALYGPISPRLWGPWPGTAALADPYADRALRQAAGKVVVLQGPPPCVPCNQSGCENHVASRSVCLEILAPARVADEALRAVFAPAPAS